MQRGSTIVDDSTSNQEPTPATPTEPEASQPATPEPQAPTDSSEPTEPISEAPIAPVKPSKSRKKLWIILAVVAVLLIGGAAAYLLSRPDTSQNKTVTVKKVTVQKSTNQADLVTSIAYLSSPKDLGDLKWFNNLGDMFGYECAEGQSSNCNIPSVTSSDITYSQIGTNADGKPIVVAWISKGMMSFNYFAVKNDDGTYTILGRISDLDVSTTQGKAALTDLQKYLASTVTVDTTTLPDEFNFPSEVSLKDTTIQESYPATPGGYYIESLAGVRGPSFNTTLKDSDIQSMGADKSRTYYAVTVKDEPLYQLKEIYGAVNRYYAKSYKVKTALAGEAAAPITWDDGTKNTYSYTARNPGCGSANGYLVAKNISNKDITIIGKTTDGQNVYQLSSDNALLLKEFNEDYAKGENLDESNLKNLSVADFQKNHGLIVVKNGFGEYAVYLRDGLFFGGGCAKPVIYLYPQHIQNVNVAVGADVKISDPHYPAGGWRNVLALPDSRLFYQGKGYGSLFWEGNGFGEYPIVRTGTVVESSQAVSTIRTQLAAQGFNDKETADFLAYWQPKLPNTPYVRLTWLTTDQMNTLAPLTISPRPQTVIRTFLQFNGLDQPIALPAQHFTAPARNGFTATEWGGLLRQ